MISKNFELQIAIVLYLVKSLQTSSHNVLSDACRVVKCYIHKRNLFLNIYIGYEFSSIHRIIFTTGRSSVVRTCGRTSDSYNGFQVNNLWADGTQVVSIEDQIGIVISTDYNQCWIITIVLILTLKNHEFIFGCVPFLCLLSKKIQQVYFTSNIIDSL